jgi:hypothetical protein
MCVSVEPLQHSSVRPITWAFCRTGSSVDNVKRAVVLEVASPLSIHCLLPPSSTFLSAVSLMHRTGPTHRGLTPMGWQELSAT